MDDDTADLIAQLCTRIGMTMEDASVDALTLRSMDTAERALAIARLEVAVDRISRIWRNGRRDGIGKPGNGKAPQSAQS